MLKTRNTPYYCPYEPSAFSQSYIFIDSKSYIDEYLQCGRPNLIVKYVPTKEPKIYHDFFIPRKLLSKDNDDRIFLHISRIHNNVQIGFFFYNCKLNKSYASFSRTLKVNFIQLRQVQNQDLSLQSTSCKYWQKVR